APALEEARRRGLKVGVLTNNSAGLGPTRMLALAGLAGLVDVALSAQLLGVKKPAPRAFLAAASALGVDPRECVFFDDTKASVDGAAAAGMRAYHVARDRKDHDLAARTVKDLGAIARVIDQENARPA
ncbi:MAG TPA: HAD-IA family hydrolase, partial [Byssovorax sp.]